MIIFKVFWKWFKDNIWRGISVFSSALLLIFGITAALRLFTKNKVIRDDKAIRELSQKITDLQVKRIRYEGVEKRSEKRIQEIKRERTALRQEIENLKDKSGMTDDEILQAFKNLGY